MRQQRGHCSGTGAVAVTAFDVTSVNDGDPALTRGSAAVLFESAIEEDVPELRH